MDQPVLSRTMSTERVTDNMERPLLDDRQYRVVRLPNQLEALLIHDADTDKASAALDVNVGSFSDDTTMPGMAHAVEHLLFMGTEKYPVENAYNQYLTAHAGYSNAYTASTSTNYYFEVAASNTPSNSKASSTVDLLSNTCAKDTDSPLYGALDRFAQFFVKPLFLEDTLDRELRAVDSENKKNLQSDVWRLHQLNRSLSNKKHPFCHFSTGNYVTLHDEPLARGVKIREEFIKFYEKHYSANLMKLVVLGREDLDTLQGWVEDLFKDVVNKDLPLNRWDDAEPYSENEKLMQIFAKPVFDSRTLDMNFAYPDEEHLYDSQPSRYLGHLIGHEGPGSILAYLKGKGWANGLSAGASPVCPGAAFFSVSVRLTAEGLKHYKEVAKTVFQYVAMLKEHEPQQWIFEELKIMSEVDFRFKQKSPASKTTSRISSVMQRPYPRDYLLSGAEIIRSFNPEAVKEGLACLSPENFRLSLVSQEVPGIWDQKEEWYGTEYKYEPIPQDFVQELQAAATATADQRPADLHLPQKNEFIPTRLDVEKKEVTEPLKHPKLVRNDDRVRTWFKKDDRFWVPKANLQITLRTPLLDVTPRTMTMAQLIQGLVTDALVEYSYAAEIAGLEYALSAHSSGFDISLSGYNDKMAVLLEKVLVSFRDLDIKTDRFEIIKERLTRGYKNWDFQQPYYQVGTYARWLNSENGWIPEQYLAEMDHISAEDLKVFLPEVLQQLHIEVLAHGNLHKSDALQFSDLVETILRPRKLPPSQWPVRRTLALPPGKKYIYERALKDPANVNHCIQYSLYVGNNQDRDLRARLLLLAQIADEPCFDQLRTKEQLGYVVFSGMSISSAVWAGYRILIQSERTPEYLENRINAFLAQLGGLLEGMTDAEFEKHKGSVINKRLERLKNLNGETERFWGHVVAETFDFALVDQDVSHLQPLTKSDITAFYNQYIDPKSPLRSQISVHLVAQAQVAAEKIADATSTADQLSQLQVLIAKVLVSNGLVVDETAFRRKFEGLQTIDEAGLLSVVAGYLAETQNQTAAEKQQTLTQGDVEGTKLVLQEVGKVINTALSGPEAVPESGSGGGGDDSGKATGEKIRDVHAWKAGLVTNPGPRAVCDLKEFEELGSKL